MSSRKNDPNYPNPYATGGHKAPIAQVTAGRKYRVRNDDQPVTTATKVWGKGLSHDVALKLKERVCGQRKSTNAIVEDEAVPFPPPVAQYVQPVAPPPPHVIQHPGHAQPPAPQPQAPAQANGETDDPILTEMGDLDIDSELGDLGAS